MPIKVQNDLPARAILESENIFVMDENRAMSQDIRPLQILILKSDGRSRKIRRPSFCVHFPIHRCRWTVRF